MELTDILGVVEGLGLIEALELGEIELVTVDVREGEDVELTEVLGVVEGLEDAVEVRVRVGVNEEVELGDGLGKNA